ncbi:MAG: ABC transporter permease [Acidobacteria bacterium]|jgi:ABC-2 type transport system permease protein|nr:ABC transporter permease [Acidobacteriota bacterium]
MNLALFRASLRSNWVLLLVFTVISTAYLVMILSMFDEEHLKQIKGAIEMAPPALSAAVGMDVIPTTLTDFAANYFYGFLVQLFLIVHVLILPARLVVRHVDRGSMSYLLSTPNSRTTIAWTQAVYMAASLAVMAVVMTTTALAFSESQFPGVMDVPAFLSLNLATFLVSLAMAAVSFFFSCIWSETKHAVGCSTAVLVSFFVLTLVGRYGHHEGFYGVAGKVSIFQLLPARAIVSGETNMLVNDGILIVLIAVFVVGGVYAFSRRDLPL